jgi:hypothetical protein
MCSNLDCKNSNLQLTFLSLFVLASSPYHPLRHYKSELKAQDPLAATNASFSAVELGLSLYLSCYEYLELRTALTVGDQGRSQ